MEPEIDNFDKSAEKVKKISESLLPKPNSNDQIEHNSFMKKRIKRISAIKKDLKI